MWGNWNKATVPKNNLITEESACEASQQEEEHLYGKTLHTTFPKGNITTKTQFKKRGNGVFYWWMVRKGDITDCRSLQAEEWQWGGQYWSWQCCFHITTKVIQKTQYSQHKPTQRKIQEMVTNQNNWCLDLHGGTKGDTNEKAAKNTSRLLIFSVLIYFLFNLIQSKLQFTYLILLLQ